MASGDNSEVESMFLEILKKFDETNNRISAMESRIEKIEGKIKLVDQLKQPVDNTYQGRIDLSSLSPTQLLILGELIKRNRSDVYELELELEKTRHYVNTSLKELYALGLLKRVKNINKEKSAIGKFHPRYFYMIDDEKMRLEEIQQQLEGL